MGAQQAWGRGGGQKVSKRPNPAHEVPFNPISLSLSDLYPAPITYLLVLINSVRIKHVTTPGLECYSNVRHEVVGVKEARLAATDLEEVADSVTHVRGIRVSDSHRTHSVSEQHPSHI
jgi:hypothetical protein